MPIFTETPLNFCIWKDQLPAVHSDNKGRPYVLIPDPDQNGKLVAFISLPGDGAAELFTLAAAYLALAQHAGQQAEHAATSAHYWDDKPNTEPTVFDDSQY